MPCNASNIVEIQYIFMHPVTGPILCAATHAVVIESVSFRLKQTVYFINLTNAVVKESGSI